MTPPRPNELPQPVGWPVEGWQPRPRPVRLAIDGRYCRVEPLEPDRHADSLFAAFADDREGRIWTYMANGPFREADHFRRWLEAEALRDDPLFHAVVDRADGRAAGVASYLRIVPETGVIEIGHIAFAPRLQRTRAATEALYLLLRRAFDELGYRRCEWKCDALNEASRRAALRLGFTFEGIFRQATIYKGRNRDTAWYSIIDREWPERRAALERWLDPANFDAAGRQRQSLSRAAG